MRRSKVRNETKATTEPNADVGSVARALANASAAVPPSAMPQGVVCLMTQHAGRVGQAATADAQFVGAQAGERLAHARLAAARAALDNARLQLAYTSVRSPLTGVVSRKQVEVGQLVSPGQPLLTIVDAMHSWVTANFKETQLEQMRIGQSVALEIDTYSDCRAEGKVESLGAATGARFALLPPDNATGNFTKVVQRIPVRIRVDRGCGPSQPLRPGLSVVVHVATR